MIRRIDHVLLIVDDKYSLPVHLHVDERLVTERKPKTIYFLISPDKVSSIDPEGRSFGRVACDFHNREVLGVDPYSPFKQILISAFRHGPKNKTVIRADFLLASQRERIVHGGDRTVVMLPTGRCLAFALDEAIKNKVTHDTRSFFGSLAERFLVGRPILHADHCLRSHFPLDVSDLVRSDCRVLLQLLVSQEVALKHLRDDVVAGQTDRSPLTR